MRHLWVVGALVLALVGSARAEPGPIGNWLMDQPVTLWDLGMIRVKDAADAVEPKVENKFGGTLVSSVSYDWDDNEILVSFVLFGFPKALNHENCNKVRQHALGALILSQIPWESENRAEWMRYEIGEWFSHYDYQKKSRDKELAYKLSRIMFAEGKAL